MHDIVRPGTRQQRVDIIGIGQVDGLMRPSSRIETNLAARRAVDRGTQLEQPRAECSTDKARCARDEKFLVRDVVNLK
jgi:hypothetical protein